MQFILHGQYIQAKTNTYMCGIRLQFEDIEIGNWAH
jgi:hypothetical protein